jgi:hypothetical protein
MDDDNDNYVPQISTMDWQNLGAGGGQDGKNGNGQGTNAGMAGGSSSFMYASAGQLILPTGAQYQLPYPGMGMPTGTQQMYSGGDYVGGGGVQQVKAINTKINMAHRFYSLLFREKLI